MKTHPRAGTLPAQLLIGFTLGICGLNATPGMAQERTASLEEVVVTAQKREQSVQDVPVAVTALTAEAMEVNRVFNVADLNGLAPNLVSRPSPGAVGTVSFSMRGITSYGSLPGTDKQISTYLDGVYLGNPRGTVFNLPTIERIEVLRGPQGTLFGRNATAGAISISTRNPLGELGFAQEVSIGSREYLRSSSLVDLPAWGPLSVAFSYVHEEQEGGIDNLGAGTHWDRRPLGQGTGTSPGTFNDIDTDSFFLAAEFAPGDNFSLTYKYDYNEEKGTPPANVPIAINPDPAVLGEQGAAFLNALMLANPEVPLYPDGRRPDKVNNNYHLPRDQTNQGHNLTATWEGDNLTIKNILAYRKTDSELSASNLVGLGYTLGFMGPVLGLPSDTPFCAVCSHVINDSEQWSNELQAVYDADFLTLTAGLLYFESENSTGLPTSPETQSFAFFAGATLFPTSSGFFSNDAESMAAYAQAEFHVLPSLDVIAGYRMTRDEKTGSYLLGPAGDTTQIDDEYKEDNPSYLVGVNYRPLEDILLYAKYSTAFVSGGSIAGVAFGQEDVEAWELGMKGDFLDNRLRANLALFDTTYKNSQSLQAGSNVGHPEISVLIVDFGGDIEARGAELELSALPLEGLTLGWSVGYTDVSYADVSDILKASNGGNLYPNSDYLPTLVPDWTSNLSASYETEPLFGNSYLSLSVTGVWHSKIRLDSNPGRADAVPQFGVLEYTPESWLVNARAVLRDIPLGAFRGEIALWGKNLTDNDYPVSALNFGSFGLSATFLEPRSYGVDLRFQF